MSDEKKGRKDELDNFWDISRLVPQKTKTTNITHRSIARSVPVKTRTYSQDFQKSVSPEEKLTIIAPSSSAKASEEPTIFAEYIDFSPLLSKVKIINWKSTYNYYEFFCRQAAAIHKKQGNECPEAPFTPFFSYVAQYSQLNRRQLAWYLWWRECVRNQIYLKTDISYINLLIFEIINLADTMDVRFGQQQLCALREAFHASYPRLGHLLNEWICDYSLIHHLPPPQTDDLTAMSDCTLKEFYVPSTGASLRYASALIAFSSNYVYTKSKFATGENRALYDKHMPGALCACIADGGEVGARMAGAGLEESRLIRDAFTGALCSHRVKRRIEVDYCSFARSHELRILVTDIMKYTENRLRAYLGVKSRLGLYALPQSFRDCIDRYLRDALPHRERATKAEPRQEYEALYDLPQTTLDPARAAQIEARSWDTTERLIAAFDDVGSDSTPIPPDPVLEVHQSDMSMVSRQEPIVAMPAETDENCSLKTALSEFVDFINCALCGDIKGQRDFARARGEMTDSIADRINEIAADAIGDILLEEDDNGGYRVLEEYLELWNARE